MSVRIRKDLHALDELSPERLGILHQMPHHASFGVPRTRDVPLHKIEPRRFPIEQPELLAALGDAFVELMSPWDETSTIAKFLDKRGEGIHHICFDTGSIAFELKRVSEEGFPVIDETPRESLGEVIAFLHPKGLNGVLVEFKEKKES